MKKVSKSKLKAQMLEYFREVERTGKPLLVTDHGRAVLEVRVARIPSPRDSAKYRKRPVDETARVSEELLAEPGTGTTLEPAYRPRRSNLDKYAGDSDFGPEWEEFLEKDLKQIDETLWS